jgi:hypothetical protein
MAIAQEADYLGDLNAITTVKPFVARCRAISRPIPRMTPVTSAMAACMRELL